MEGIPALLHVRPGAPGLDEAGMTVVQLLQPERGHPQGQATAGVALDLT